MSMEHAILGFLTYKPLSGYDLKKFFDDSVGHFWSGTQSQIYRTLGRMEENGWVRQEVIRQEDRPDRKEYHLTESGYEELMDWLSEPITPSPHRHQWLLQVFFAHDLPNEAIIGLLRKRAAMLRQVVEHTREEVPPIIEQRQAEVGSARAARLWQVSFDYGIAHLEWEIGWLEETADRLSEELPEA